MQNARFTLLVVSLLFMQFAGHAQSRQRWSFGPRLGLNLTNFTGSTINSSMQADPNFNKLLPGVSAGIGFIYSDVSRFGFAFDVLYSQRGSQSTVSSGRSITRVNYLEVPITARYFLNRSGNFRPNIYAGIVPAARLNAALYNTNNSSNRIDVTDVYRTADLGITAGFQANFRAGDRQRFTVDARYTQGVTNISTLTTDVRNQMITIGLGYNFGIGREYRPGDRKLPIRER